MQKVIWVKQTIAWFLAFLVIFSAASMIRSPSRTAEEWENPYVDVTQDMWSYQAITELNRQGVLPTAEKFEPVTQATRGDLLTYLYNMDSTVYKSKQKKRAKQQKNLTAPTFTDVTEEAAYYDAVQWACKNGLASGTSDTTFSPENMLTREQVCTILARFAALEEMQLVQLVEPNQFMDSLYIQDYARSGVTACQLAGIIKGYDDGFFYPANTMSRQECAAVIYRMLVSAQGDQAEDAKLVDLTAGAYDSLYDSYTDIPHTVEVPALETPVDPSFFDKAVFIGDSVSLTLESYATASGALGNAQFLCAGSMSASNMLTGQILPEYPKGSGQKPPIADSVAATGAQVIYVMLGMDNIAFGLERSTGDMAKILQSIVEKCPDATIIIESVTPMAQESKSYSDKLNNDTINAYNDRMKQMCEDNKWYYVDVAEAVRDSNGFLTKEYCSDYGRMGMHFNYDGAKVWVQYLLTHVPERLLK